MRSRQDEIKLAVRHAARKICSTEIEGDFDAVMVKRLQIIKSTVEFVVSDINEGELRTAIVETFKEIDSERNALEPIAQFCEQSMRS
jgi:hypothetical protein